MNLERIRQQLQQDEGTGPMKAGRHLPYVDTVGKTTIGYGRNISDRGISSSEAALLLDHDITDTVRDVLARYPWVGTMDEARQAVIIQLVFNIGLTSFSGFTQTIPLIQARQYDQAADRLLQSKWARQVGARAQRLAEQLRRGEFI